MACSRANGGGAKEKARQAANSHLSCSFGDFSHPWALPLRWYLEAITEEGDARYWIWVVVLFLPTDVSSYKEGYGSKECKSNHEIENVCWKPIGPILDEVEEGHLDDVNGKVQYA